MRALFAFVMCVALIGGIPAFAQTSPDATLVHFRAYRAALDRGDVAVAAQEAALALEASEAAHGNGGRTAVLALNLATARLLMNDYIGAIAPAQRAVTLAENGAPGVNATFAGLILGRAELAAGSPLGADRLSQLLAGEAALVGVPDTEIYPAASALGVWATENEDYERARAAWATGARYAAGSRMGEEYGLARARIGEGSAIILEELSGRRRQRMDRDNAMEAFAMLSEAYALLRPMAQVEAPRLELTVAQNAYADALLWLSVIRIKLGSDRQPMPVWPGEAQGDADGMSELGPVDLTLQRCLVRLRPSPRPEFPEEELNNSQLGVVVIRLEFDAAGEVVRHAVVARAGSEGFQRAIERVADRWSVDRREDSTPNCRMPRTMLMPFSFGIR